MQRGHTEATPIPSIWISRHVVIARAVDRNGRVALEESWLEETVLRWSPLSLIKGMDVGRSLLGQAQPPGRALITGIVTTVDVLRIFVRCVGESHRTPETYNQMLLAFIPLHGIDVATVDLISLVISKRDLRLARRD